MSEKRFPSQFVPPSHFPLFFQCETDFVSKLLLVDVKKRMTADQALEHPWLKSKVAPNKLQSQFSRRLQTTVTTRRQETMAAAIGADF